MQPRLRFCEKCPKLNTVQHFDDRGVKFYYHCIVRTDKYFRFGDKTYVIAQTNFASVIKDINKEFEVPDECPFILEHTLCD